MVAYGGALYGAAAMGRINASFQAAQAAIARQTALRISVIDNQINRWTYVGGTVIDIPANPMSAADKANSTDQSFRGYRFGMSMCILVNGNIIRVRIGDGSFSDRQIYYQTITDPTVASQWTTWGVLYSGVHYAVAVVPATSSSFHVYSAKSDGMYKNNAQQNTQVGIIEINPVIGQTDAMFATRVVDDSIDGRRAFYHYYTYDITTTPPVLDAVNYRWYRSEISALKLSDGRIARVQVAAFHINPRVTNLAESLTISFAPAYNDIEPIDPPLLIRGFAGQAGSNSIINPYLTKLADGYYYLFYSEVRYDADKTLASNAVKTLFWQRSIDLRYWSEPVAIGYDIMNPTGIGIVESGGYAYLANNGAVYSRPTATITHDISNYVGRMELEDPKQNQPGTASFPVANPAGVNDWLLDLTDCEVKLEAGLLCADGVYRYSEFGRWWIDKVKASVHQRVSRLEVTLYDLWRRLDNPLRDNYNNIGQVNWRDWMAGGKNQLFNYYPKGGTYAAVTEHSWKYVRVRKPTSKNFFLYTGWKGHNGEVWARIRTRPTSTHKFGVIYRYVDNNNYYWAYSNGTGIYIVRVQGGKSTTLLSHSKTISGTFTIGVEYRWSRHRVYINGDLEVTLNTESGTGGKPGYAGVRGTGADYNFYNFGFTDWQPAITTNDLIRTLLAMGDFHLPSVAGGEDQQLAVVWGPQTDLNTPAKALQSLCEQYKLSLAWRNNRVEVGQFKELTIVDTYNNEVLEFSQTEEVGQRINLASVDGREDSWIEIDGPDTRFRGRQIVAYFDVPELATDDQVRLRSVEEIRKGVVGSAYECKMPLQFDLWRMDGVVIVDNNGSSYTLRVEGLKVEVDQTDQPRQTMTLELSPLT